MMQYNSKLKTKCSTMFYTAGAFLILIVIKMIGSKLLLNTNFIQHQSKHKFFLEWINKNVFNINDIFDFDDNQVKRFAKLYNEP